MEKVGMKIFGLLIVFLWVTGCATMNDAVRPKEQGEGTSEVQSLSVGEVWQSAKTFFSRVGPRDLSPAEVVGDFVWVRPLGILQTALQTWAFVISLPVTTPLKKTQEAKEFLITYPYYYYIKRPLREM